MCVYVCVCVLDSLKCWEKLHGGSAALSPAEQLRPVYNPPQSRRGEANGTGVDCRGTSSRCCRRGCSLSQLV